MNFPKFSQNGGISLRQVYAYSKRVQETSYVVFSMKQMSRKISMRLPSNASLLLCAAETRSPKLFIDKKGNTLIYCVVRLCYKYRH